MAGGQGTPGTQGGASGPGPDHKKKTTDESTRTPSLKRGPQPTGTTPEPPKPQAPNPSTPEQGSHSNTTSGPATTQRATPVRRKPSKPPGMLARRTLRANLMVLRTMTRGPRGREAGADGQGTHPLSGNKPDVGQGRIAPQTKVKAPTVASLASPADPRGIQSQRAKQRVMLVRAPSPANHGQVIRNPKGKRNPTRPQGRTLTRLRRIQISLSRSRKSRTARPLGPPVVVVILLLGPPRPLTSKSGTCPWRRRHLCMPNPFKGMNHISVYIHTSRERRLKITRDQFNYVWKTLQDLIFAALESGQEVPPHSSLLWGKGRTRGH